MKGITALVCPVGRGFAGRRGSPSASGEVPVRVMWGEAGCACFRPGGSVQAWPLKKMDASVGAPDTLTKDWVRGSQWEGVGEVASQPVPLPQLAIKKRKADAEAGAGRKDRAPDPANANPASPNQPETLQACRWQNGHNQHYSFHRFQNNRLVY